MSEHQPKRGRALKVTTNGKAYEELPFGPTIMVTHPAHAWCPPTDVFECADLYVIKCAISGLRHDEQGRIQETTISVHGDTINIRGQRRDKCNIPRCSAFRIEIHYGAFQCKVRIHEPFDADGITSEYEDGFLKVMVPKKNKKKSAPAPRRPAKS